MLALRRIGQDAIHDFENVLAFPGVGGLLIESDPLLRVLWRLYWVSTEAEWTRLENDFSHISLWTLPDWSRWSGLYGTQLTPCDPEWTCAPYEKFRDERFRDRPGVRFSVLHDPSASTESLAELRRLVLEIPWPVRLLARPTAVAQVSAKAVHRPVQGGISLGPDGQAANGTLGGLRRINGAWYAITCGHVLPTSASHAVQPSEPDGGSTMRVGSVVSTTDGTLIDPGVRCTAKSTANSLDVALVSLDPAIAVKHEVRSLGQVSGTVAVADVAEDQPVRVAARSGVRSLVVGALALRRSVAISGQTYCFEDLIELRWPGRKWAWKGALNSPTRVGDSGAWVLRQEAAGYGWLGMVTAGDGPVAYAQFAESVDTWVQANVP